MAEKRGVTLTCFLLSFFLFGATALSAKEKIIWPYVCFKPVYMCNDSTLVDGSGFNIYNLLWQEMDDSEHVLLNMPIKRIIENGKQGREQLFYGLYKTKEREEYFHFSLPCRISTPTYLVIRKSDLSSFGNGRPVSLRQLLDNESLSFLYLESISFGKGIDEILEEYKNKPHVLTEYNTSSPINKTLKLLLNDRVDYMLSMDGTPHEAKQMGVSDQIVYLPIQEQNHYDIGYVVAPKNDWGKNKIEQVNEILRANIPTETFFQFFVPLVDESMVSQLREQYNKHILAPVNQPVRIATIQANPVHEMAKAVLEEAYKRVGYTVDFAPFPGIRSLTMANKGEADGDAARILGTEKKYTNLQPVPTSFMSFEGYAFSKKHGLEINEWKDLQGLRVGIVRGIRFAEIGTKGMDPYYAENVSHLFKLLEEDRIEVAVATKLSGQVQIRKNHSDSGIKMIGKPLYSAPLYHFVNKDKGEIIPRLDKVMKQMQARGEVSQIIEERYQTLLSSDHSQE